MRVSCLVSNIEKALPTISRILPFHSQLPVLSNILLQANEKGFFLTATDLELAIKIHIPAKIDEEGAATIPGKQFIEVINSIPKDKIEILKEKDLIHLKYLNNTVTFQTIPKEEFPQLFEKKGENIINFSQKEIEEMFSQVTFATSQDLSRPQLNGIYIQQKDDQIYIVATDGFRLSFKKNKKKFLKKIEKGIIVSSRLIFETLSSKKDPNTEISVYLYKEGNQLVIEGPDQTLVGRLIEGEFPPYEKVIPSDFKTAIKILREEFVQAVKLASVFSASANVIKLKAKDNRLEFFAQSQGIGEGNIKVDVEKTGEDVEISFNAKFLLDYLKNSESEKITIHLNSGNEPAMFTNEGDDLFIHIIMPVRIQE